MAKICTTFLFVTLLVFSTTLAHARSLPLSHAQVAEKEDDNVGSCEGVNEEECLMRRTLVAHLDYIYTQQQNP
ncbi:unnamed protein product [Amaranthus hypochondriacus]